MHLLLIGGGHALLPTLAHARTWTRTGHRVTLVDPHRHLYYSGMVPEYLGGVYRRDEVRIDLTAHAHAAGVAHVQARATALDAGARTMTLDTGDVLRYDAVAFDIGGVNPHQPNGAIPTKPIAAIERLEDRVRAFLRTSGSSLRVAVVGGGAAGVEIAMNLLGRAHAAGRLPDLSLTLLEADDKILARFPEGMQRAVARHLVAYGTTLRTATRVARIEDGQVHTHGGESHAADAVLWATGSVGPDVLRTSGLPTDARGFLLTDRTLRSLGDPHVFAGGDCATVQGLEHLAKVGVHAVKHGAVLRANLHRTLVHRADRGSVPPADALQPFRPYPAAPLVLSTGTDEALWMAGNRWLRGRPALRLKHWIDRRWIRAYAPAWAGASWTDLQRPDAASAMRWAGD